jgi:hypothetical protein
MKISFGTLFSLINQEDHQMINIIKFVNRIHPTQFCPRDVEIRCDNMDTTSLNKSRNN